MALILASNSPRRRELLRQAGIEFTVRPANIDESPQLHEPAAAYVKRIAQAKALAVARTANAGTLVLGADTSVLAAGQMLGKPRDAGDAARMLRLLSGTTHHVVTGFALARSPDTVETVGYDSAVVVFRPLTEAQIRDYVASGEPMDKAGSYAIQGVAANFVVRIEGNSDTVVGLPVAAVVAALKSLEGR